MIEYWKNKNLESLFYIDENGIIQQEEWRDVPDFKNIYQGSNLGRLKSLTRLVKGKIGMRVQKERILSQNISENGYIFMSIHKNSNRYFYSMQQLIAMCFLNHIPRGHEKIVDHINNNPLDNRLQNLQIITPRKNNLKDKKNKTGFVGVNFDNKANKFRANIVINYKSKNLGSYNTAEEANFIFNKAFCLLEKGEDISHLIKSQKESESGYKNVYKNHNLFIYKFMHNKTIYSEGSFINPKTAYEAMILKKEEMGLK